MAQEMRAFENMENSENAGIKPGFSPLSQLIYILSDNLIGTNFQVVQLQILPIFKVLKLIILDQGNPFTNDKIWTFPNWKNLQATISNLMKNGRKLSKWLKTLWEMRNCSSRAISPFPTVFSKNLHCRQVKTRACLGKG